MRRIFALIWLSLSLAIASGPAFAVPSLDCPKAHPSSMTGGHDRVTDRHDGLATSHGDMDCCAESCATDCAAVCPSMVLPPDSLGMKPAARRTEQRTLWPSTMLKSAALAATDPPPRTIFS